MANLTLPFWSGELISGNTVAPSYKVTPTISRPDFRFTEIVEYY